VRFDAEADKGSPYNVQVVRALSRALKVDPEAFVVSVSSFMWNALKGLGWDLERLEEAEDCYVLTQIACGRKVYLHCDPQLDDHAIEVAVESEEEEDNV
jgi:hypothetical protein